jgi:hypothetical protein
VAGKVPVKRNRFVKLVGADKSINRALETKARALAGWKGYITNLPAPNSEFVIGTYQPRPPSAPPATATCCSAGWSPHWPVPCWAPSPP